MKHEPQPACASRLPCNHDRRARESQSAFPGRFTRKIALGLVHAVSLKNTVCGDSSLDSDTCSWYMLTHGYGLLVSTQTRPACLPG